jgi:NAD(P)-dependent dehydrogenase (short-subunit alcohol dehydrogenase family)
VLDGRVVAITGASSERGAAIALALAEQGAAVALAARRADRLDALARRIEDEGGRALALPTDVADERQARAFVEHAYEHLGRLDVLVNAAAAPAPGPVEGADTERWRRALAVDLLGVLYCTHAALPVMRAQGSGRILTVACPDPGSASAATTRAALVAFSAALADEVAPLGIEVAVLEAADGAAIVAAAASRTPAG